MNTTVGTTEGEVSWEACPKHLETPTNEYGMQTCNAGTTPTIDKERDGAELDLERPRGSRVSTSILEYFAQDCPDLPMATRILSLNTCLT